METYSACNQIGHYKNFKKINPEGRKATIGIIDKCLILLSNGADNTCAGAIVFFKIPVSSSCEKITCRNCATKNWVESIVWQQKM